MAGDIDTIELNDNLKFLIACSQTEPTENNIKFIEQFLSSIDIQKLIPLAIGHGILPLVYKTLKYLGTKHLMVNTEILSELKAHYMDISQRNMLKSAELIRIMKLLAENDIEVLAFKGPALAQMAYGNITLRQYADLAHLHHPLPQTSLLAAHAPPHKKQPALHLSHSPPSIHRPVLLYQVYV